MSSVVGRRCSRQGRVTGRSFVNHCQASLTNERTNELQRQRQPTIVASRRIKTSSFVFPGFWMDGGMENGVLMDGFWRFDGWMD